MRVVVIGYGQLGCALETEAESRGVACRVLRRPEFDLIATDASERALATKPDVVFNTAACHAVDRIETDAALAREAYLVNADAVGRLARACEVEGTVFVTFSTDYVFGPASGAEPIRVLAPPDPLCVYGRSKLAGEALARAYGNSLVVRTSCLFGPGGSAQKPNFIETALRLASSSEPVRIVSDQVFRPTAAGDLARTAFEIASKFGRRLHGHRVWHVTNGGSEVSWWDLADFVWKVTDKRPRDAQPCSTEKRGAPARRPAYSVLDLAETVRALGRSTRDWRDAVRDYLRRRGD